MQMLPMLIFTLLASSVLAAAGDGGSGPPIPSFSHAGLGSAAAVTALIGRVLPNHPTAAQDFELEVVKSCSSPPPKGARSKLCFELKPGSKPGALIVPHILPSLLHGLRLSDVDRWYETFLTLPTAVTVKG